MLVFQLSLAQIQFYHRGRTGRQRHHHLLVEWPPHILSLPHPPTQPFAKSTDREKWQNKHIQWLTSYTICIWVLKNLHLDLRNHPHSIFFSLLYQIESSQAVKIHTQIIVCMHYNPQVPFVDLLYLGTAFWNRWSIVFPTSLAVHFPDRSCMSYKHQGRCEGRWEVKSISE